MVAHRVLFDAYTADHLVADPGDAGSILLAGKSEGVVQVVTAAAETRTLPAPLKAGVTVAIILYTDGGNCTLTVTNGYNNDNDTDVTLDDAGDFVKLESFNIGGTYRWRVLASHGIAELPEEGTISVDTINESTAGSGVTVDGVILKDTTVDVNGTADALILDADADTTISAPTDDQIDVEIAGADDFVFVANIFRALSGSVLESNTINETTAGSGVTIDGVLVKDTTIDVNGTADAVILDADADTTISAPTDDQIDFEVAGADDLRLAANDLQVLDSTVLSLLGATTGTGRVIQRIGATATEGLEMRVYEATVSPAAVETNLVNIPANSAIMSVQSNVETALTGGGTTVTYSIGTTGDPDKYGTPSSDLLTQNAKSNFIPAWTFLTSSEQMVLTGAATGGASDGDTALSVGSVRVRVVYLTLVNLDNA